MRAQPTEAESRLWYHLRGGRLLALKFKRQKPIGRYIVDFVCLDIRLVIEADGGQHGDARDLQRDAYLRARGFSVLRFWNNDVLGQTEAVLAQIRAVALTLSPSPSPASGRGEQRRHPLLDE